MSEQWKENLEYICNLHRNERKYIQLNISEHKLKWVLNFGPVPDGYEIDHINGEKYDNRLENLRLLTPKQNTLNREGIKFSKKYGNKYKGVHFDEIDGHGYKNKKPYRAIFSAEYYGGKRLNKRFETEIEAAIQYNEWANEWVPSEIRYEHDLPGNVAGRDVLFLNKIEDYDINKKKTFYGVHLQIGKLHTSDSNMSFRRRGGFKTKEEAINYGSKFIDFINSLGDDLYATSYGAYPYKDLDNEYYAHNSNRDKGNLKDYFSDY